MGLHKDLTGADLHVNKVHATTHAVAGTDPLVLAESQITDLSDLVTNVKAFECLDGQLVQGDGVHDDTTGIQLAIDTVWESGGGTILFYGRFKITNSLLVRPMVNLRGLGSARAIPWGSDEYTPKSEIRNAATNGANALVITIDSTKINDANKGYYAPNFTKISNLYISGNALSGHGIQIGDPTDGHALNDYAYSYGYNTIIENCLIVSHGLDGIHCSGAPSCKILNNDVVMNGRYGMSTWVDSNGFIIQGNHFQGNTGIGCFFFGLWGSSFIGNTIEGNHGETEMQISQSQGLAIIGNYYEGDLVSNYAFGIVVNVDNHNVTIKGNRFQVHARCIDIAAAGTGKNTDFDISNNYGAAGSGYAVLVRSTAEGCKSFRLSLNYTVDHPTAPYSGLAYLNNVVIEDDDGLHAAQFRVSALNTAPANAGATGTLGEIRITADAIYACVATDTWVKAALATWA